MLHIIIGRAHSGKSEYLLDTLKAVINDGFECVFIVPEQESVQTEKKLCKEIGDIYNMKCEVLNFERLPNRIYREYGGLTANILDSASARVLLALSVRECADKLHVYKKSGELPEFTDKLFSEISSLKSERITPLKLFHASDELKERDVSLSSKLHDIALIYSEYQNSLGNDRQDSFDALSILAEKLSDMRFFENKAVFIDGYRSYTEQEYCILKHIISQSVDTYITLICDFEDKSGVFTEAESVYEKLRGFISYEPDDVYLGNNTYYLSDSIKHIEANMFKTNVPRIENDDGVTVTECADIFDEAETAAYEINTLVRSGLRYRDINIACRNTSDYDGVINTILEKYNIPFYFSEKEDLTSQGISSLIISCFDIASSDYSLQSVKKYIKSGYAPLTLKEADILITYADTWKLRSKSWYCSDEWAMNPDGYKAEFSSRAQYALCTANHARQKLMQNLAPLIETLNRKDTTVKSALTAIYEHLIAIKANTRLYEKASRLSELGKSDEATRLTAVWGTLMKSFDSVCSICGERIIPPKHLAFLVSSSFGEYKLGTIPNSADSVNIGDASLIRPDNCKAMILLGVNDGVFPATPSSNSLFSKSELKSLSDFGIENATSPEREMDKERFIFYYVCSRPSKKLSILFSSGNVSGSKLRISSAALHILSLFKGLDKSHYNEMDKIFCERVLYEKYLLKSDDEFKSRVREYFSGNRKYIERSTALSPEEANISGTNAPFLTLSPSRLDCYRQCPFAYFSRYVLKLKELKEAKVNSSEIGTYIHKVVELFISRHMVTNTLNTVTNAEIESEFASIAEEARITACGATNQNALASYSLTRLNIFLIDALKNIRDEFTVCDFRPLTTEENFCETVCETDNGTKIIMHGKIDRIDAYDAQGKRYLRIIDYKTGKIAFSLDRVENGLSLQMLIYLFAYCEKLGENVAPAGILYMPLSPSPIKQENGKEDSTVIVNSFKRLGLLCNDAELLSHMEVGLQNQFIPAKLSKDGSFNKNVSRVASEEEFNSLKETVIAYTKSIGEGISEGRMSIKPFKYAKTLPCTYCEMKPFCRSSRA